MRTTPARGVTLAYMDRVWIGNVGVPRGFFMDVSDEGCGFLTRFSLVKSQWLADVNLAKELLRVLHHCSCSYPLQTHTKIHFY